MTTRSPGYTKEIHQQVTNSVVTRSRNGLKSRLEPGGIGEVRLEVLGCEGTEESG